MSHLITLNVAGLGDVLVHSEYTISDVQDAYTSLIKPIVDIWNTGRLVVVSNPSSSTDPIQQTITQLVDPSKPALTNTDAVNLQNYLAQLVDIAQNGLVVGGKKYYLTIEMAQAVDKIRRTLNAVGFDESGANPSANVDAIKRWQDLTNIGLQQIMLSAASAVENNKSLQSLVELEYVKTGNEVIGGNLKALDTALESTKSILDVLQIVQDMHNQVEAQTRDNQWLKDYVNSLKAHGTQPNDALCWSNIEDFESNISQKLDQAFAYLPPKISTGTFRGFPMQETQTIQVQTGTDPFTGDPIYETQTVTNLSTAFINYFTNTAQKLEGELTKLRARIGGPPDEPGSLAEALSKTLTDMQAAINHPGNIYTGISNWLLDGYQSGQAVNTGNIQRNITEAITAGENLNDRQKEDLRRFMYVFEEFYKSASAILQALTRMIEKMAQGIKQ